MIQSLKLLLGFLLMMVMSVAAYAAPMPNAFASPLALATLGASDLAPVSIATLGGEISDPKGKPLTSSERFHLGIGLVWRFEDIPTAKINDLHARYYLVPRVQYDCLKYLALEARLPLALSRRGDTALELGIFVQK